MTVPVTAGSAITTTRTGVFLCGKALVRISFPCLSALACRRESQRLERRVFHACVHENRLAFASLTASQLTCRLLFAVVVRWAITMFNTPRAGSAAGLEPWW